MSRYFQTLKKLQQQQVEEASNSSSSAVAPAPHTPEPAPKWEPESPEQVFPELPLAYREAAWNHMLESLRSEVQSAQPALVVAGVSEVESTRRLFDGLRRQAKQRGISIRLAQLTQSQDGRILRLLPEVPDSARDPENTPPGPLAVQDFAFSGHQMKQELADWIRSSSSGTDLLVIETPGVLGSADTILVAKACDGLAIVVEPSITDRKALVTAVKRAQASDCTIVGLIISGHREWLPRWLRKLLPD